jgi:plastocyanin
LAVGGVPSAREPWTAEVETRRVGASRPQSGGLAAPGKGHRAGRPDGRAAGRLHSAVRIFLLFAAALPSAHAFAQAAVEGRVALPKSHTAPVLNKRYEIVTKGGILSTSPPLAVVYLEGSFPPPATAPAARMAQKDMSFLPTVLPVQVGTRVEFPNLDDMYHNIFSYSPAKRFDLGRYRSDERPVPSVLFDRPGLVVLRCDIHEHMRGIILVLATPYFVVTDPEGRYRLNGVPAGHYVLKAWVDSRTTLARPVDLKEGATLTLDFP